MKAIVFTLDAIFALMIASVGVSIIIYFIYSSPIPSALQYSSSSSLLTEMASAKMSSISGVGLAQLIFNQSTAFNQTWDQRAKDAANSGGNGYGPSLYTVAYTVNVPSQIMNGTIVADYGNVYFGAGNIIYAINASDGKIIWTSPVPFNAVFYAQAYQTGYSQFATPVVNATLLYNGALIYATTANTVALNAFNGTQIWSISAAYGQTCTDDVNPGPTGRSEPDGDEASVYLLAQAGKIFTGTYDVISGSVDTSGYPIYAIYASNGTIISASDEKRFIPCTSGGIFQYQTEYAALADGQMAIGTPGTGTSQLFMLTNIYNATANAMTIWIQNPPSASVGGIATYANVIGMVDSGRADLFSVSNTLIADPTMPGSIADAATSYNGRFIFQSNGGVTLLTPQGQQIWQQTTPAAYGSGLLNATPVQTQNKVFTVWSKPTGQCCRYIAAENLSTGIFTQSVELPYGGSVNPFMAIAYGKLFASVNNILIAFGTCQASSNSSILAALGTMYINNQGSCADYLLNTLQNSENTSFSVDNQSIQTVTFFNGQSSSNVLVPYSSQLAVNGPFTVSLWFTSNVPSASPAFTSNLINTRTTNHNTFSLTLKGNGASPGISAFVGSGAGMLAAPSNVFTVQPDTWYNAVLEFTKTGCSIFVNGANTTPAGACTYSSANPAFMYSTPSPGTNLQIAGGGTNPFKGSITDIQLYNTSLSTLQIGQIYRDGISGPPVSQSSIVAWFPLAGDANGYGNIQTYPGFASGISYVDTSYNSTGLINSFSVSAQITPSLLFNYSTGKYSLYNVGVYSWK